MADLQKALQELKEAEIASNTYTSEQERLQQDVDHKRQIVADMKRQQFRKQVDDTIRAGAGYIPILEENYAKLKRAFLAHDLPGTLALYERSVAGYKAMQEQYSNALAMVGNERYRMFDDLNWHMTPAAFLCELVLRNEHDNRVLVGMYYCCTGGLVEVGKNYDARAWTKDYARNTILLQGRYLGRI